MGSLHGGGRWRGRGRGRGGEAPARQEEHLRNVQERLRTAINLGLRLSLVPSDGKRKQWWNTDAEVQGQAVRAILAFVAVVKSNKVSLASVQKSLVEDTIAALEGLLAADSERIYAAAAEATAELVTAGGGWVPKFGSHELVVPLIHLLSCSKRGPATSSAIALRIIFETVKPKSCAGHDSVWRLLEEADTFGILMTRLQKDWSQDGEGRFLYVAFADLLVLILQYWPMSRFRVGSNNSFRAMLVLQCRIIDDAIPCAALKVCTALALCGGVAMLQIKDAEATWSCISHCLHKCQKHSIRLEALKLFASLCVIPFSCSSVSRPHLEAICGSTLKIIAEGSSMYKEKWPPAVEALILEACHAAQNLLRWSGEHHLLFWKDGIAIVLADLLVPKSDTKELEQWQNSDSLDATHKSGRQDKLLGPVLWDILGWLAAHADTFVEESVSGSRKLQDACNRLLFFAIQMMLRVMNRRGQKQFPKIAKHSPADINHSGLEGVVICRAVLQLLSSRSNYLATHIRDILEQALHQLGSNWLRSLINVLALRFSSLAASNDLVTLMNLMSVASLSHLTECRKQLLQEGVLEMLTEAIQACTIKANEVELTGVFIAAAATIHGNRCCWDGMDTWEGQDPILFFSLWAFASLARGSALSKRVRERFMSKISNVDWKGELGVDVDDCLLRLASDNAVAAGIRWLASYCLACCGLFGFPTAGMDLRNALNNPALADVVLVLGNGCQFHAHMVVLATKSPDLLPPNFNPGSCKNLEPSLTLLGAKTEACLMTDGKLEQKCAPVQLHLSGRLHAASVRAILEFLYKGFTLIDEDTLSEIMLLAKKCHLESFLKLLQGKLLVWGKLPSPCDFTSALGQIGHQFFDIILQATDEVQVTCTFCTLDKCHMHAHRVILSSRCSYFEALFRSGMQDSALKIMKLPVCMESLKKLLLYIYSGILPQLQFPESGCMWSSYSHTQQIQYLQSYVELAKFAEQLLLEDLQEQCLFVVQKQLKSNLHLASEVLENAALCHQWEFVEVAAECVASNFPQMRDSGELDRLEDYLVDIIRTAHVKISMNSIA